MISIFHNIERSSADKLRARYKGFYNYVKGICSLRVENPNDTFASPYIIVQRHEMHDSIGLRTAREMTWDDIQRNHNTTINMEKRLLALARDDRYGRGEDMTEDYYKAFMFLCYLCHMYGKVRIHPTERDSEGYSIAHLPVANVKRVLDEIMFHHHKSELVRVQKDLTSP
jgi:hypothetical protein